MKQYLFLATAIATASLFTGCSNNEYVGDQPEAFNGTDGAIVFSMGKANTTRTEPIGGKDAAGKLNDVFYVYGEKYYTGTPGTSQKVFDTYKVKYTVGSANSTASNTTGWEYVGNLWDNGGHEKSHVSGGVVTQTIKYWDYSASKYTFYAFSAKPDDVTKPDDVNSGEPKIKVSQIDKSDPTSPSYTVTIKKGASIGDLYFADKKVVNKNEYPGAVQLTFRNLAAKVRVGFYETVPGYKIKITKMSVGENSSSTQAFLADCPNTEASQDSKITVTYITDAGATQNRAFVSEKNNADNTTRSLSEKSELTLGGGVFTDPLSTTSSSPTWDNGGDYTFFWPQTGNTAPLKIKVDYTLTSTDGSNETITVTGATATVPADYVKWAANTAYTYIFKISDNTNGTTGGTGDPAGLYPITFDAAVVDMTENTYLTTVSTPSVTVSQNGTNFVDPDGLKFASDKEITLKVMVNGSEKYNAEIKGEFVGTYDYTKTPAQNVTIAEAKWTTISDYKLTARTGQENGYWVLKVSVTEGGSENQTTSTTYVIIRVGSAEDPANP